MQPATKIFYVFLVVLALAYYWLFPGVNILRHTLPAVNELESHVTQLPAPIITKVFVLPNYFEENGEFYYGKLHLSTTTSTLLVIGQNFKSLDENDPEKKAILKIGDQQLVPKKNILGPEVDDIMIEVEINNNILSQQPNRSIEILATREGKISNIFSLTSAEIARQLMLAQSEPPKILEAIPVGYPINEYGQEVSIRFLIAGWPNIQQGILESGRIELEKNSIPCVLTVDEETYNCWTYFTFVNLNILDWRVPLNQPSHTAKINLGGVSSPLFSFDTSEFERRGLARQELRKSYYAKLTTMEKAAGTFASPLVSQNKNNSLVALAINFVLTLIAAFLLRPWSFKSYKRWSLTFVLPVAAHLFVGIAYGILLLSGGNSGFLSGAELGSWLIGLSLTNTLIPLIEALVVSSVIVFSVKMFKESVSRSS